MPLEPRDDSNDSPTEIFPPAGGGYSPTPPPPPSYDESPTLAYSQSNDFPPGPGTSQFDIGNYDTPERPDDADERAVGEYRQWAYNEGLLAKRLTTLNRWLRTESSERASDTDIGIVRSWVNLPITQVVIGENDVRYNGVKTYMDWATERHSTLRDPGTIQEHVTLDRITPNDEWVLYDWAEGLLSLEEPEEDNTGKIIAGIAAGVAALILIVVLFLVFGNDDEEDPEMLGDNPSTSQQAPDTKAQDEAREKAAQERADAAAEKKDKAEQEAKDRKEKAKEAAEKKAEDRKEAAEKRKEDQEKAREKAEEDRKKAAEDRIVVPNVSAATVDDAIDDLEDAGFKVARTGLDQNGKRVSLSSNGDASVVSTNPNAGSVAQKSDNPEVTLTISVEEEEKAETE